MVLGMFVRESSKYNIGYDCNFKIVSSFLFSKMCRKETNANYRHLIDINGKKKLKRSKFSICFMFQFHVLGASDSLSIQRKMKQIWTMIFYILTISHLIFLLSILHRLKYGLCLCLNIFVGLTDKMYRQIQ